MQNPASFIFGGNTGTPTVDSLKKRREIADMLAAQATGGGEYKNWGDGVGMIAKALGAKYMDSKLLPQEAAQKQSTIDMLAKIQGGLGPEGISQGDFQSLSGLTENPYAPPGIESVARTLMRRQVQPDQMPVAGAPGGFTGAGVQPPQGMPPQPPMMQGGAGADALMGQAGGDRFGAPPPPPPDLNALQQQFDAAPTDMNGMLLEQAKRQGQGLPPLAEPGWIEGMNKQMGGPGARLAGTGDGPERLYQVAQADTGTQSDALTPYSDSKLTEAQSKDVGFWNRMDAIEGDITAHNGDLTALGEKMKSGIPLVGNMMVSEGYQKGKRAADEWITALLRKDTGAAVTKEEWELYGPIYMPQPGDSEGTLAEKAEARKRAAEGLRAGLGTAGVLAQELRAARQQTAPPAAAGNDDWRNADPSTWTDEQLREFTQ